MKAKKEVKEELPKEEVKQEEQLIDPNDIVFEAGGDEDMPEPETKSYDDKSADDNKRLKPTFTFIKLFEECMGKLPYSSILKNSNNDSIKLIDLMKFVEAKHDEMSVSEMNTIIGFIANCPMEYVRPLMEIIENAQRQPELWTLV